MDNPETINVLSLCTGYGGLELGLAGAVENPMRIVAVEIEAFALANLAAKAQEDKLAVEAMWPDLRTFPAKRFRGCFDFVIAGYPCQPFSVAGKRTGGTDVRYLWPDIARIIKAVKPVWFFGENVPGHLSLGLPDVYCSLRDMGYKVEAGLFTAAEVGAPHKRERLFVLANNTKSRSWKLSIRWGRQEQTSIDIDGSSQKLADAGGAELQGRQSEQGNDGLQLAPFAGSGCLWPARPGQPQYEWEQPRVIVENTGKRRRIQQEKIEKGKQNGRIKHTSGQGQTQSRLGRVANGTAFRVDRLRLLGNGVVPKQAKKAFRELIRRF